MDNGEIIPRTVKEQLVLDVEREKANQLSKEETEKFYHLMDLETVSEVLLAMSISPSTIRLMIRAIELGKPQLPEVTRDASDKIIEELYGVLFRGMKDFIEGRCPDCGEIHEDAKRRTN